MTFNRLWTPKEIETALWLDAADSSTIVENSGVVNQWSDKSGNNRHAVASNMDNRPTFVSNGLNGKGVINFDGNDKYLSWDLSSFNTSRAIYCVLRWTNTSGDYRHIFISLDAWHGDTSSSGRLISNSYTVSTGVKNGQGYKDGSQLSPLLFNRYTNFTIHVFVTSIPVATYATGCQGGFPNRAFYGDFAEIIITESVPEEGEREKIEGYLAHKWGLEGNLPSDHPYKNSPPTMGNDGLISMGNDGLISYYSIENNTNDIHHNANHAIGTNISYGPGKNNIGGILNGTDSDLVLPIDYWKSICFWYKEPVGSWNFASFVGGKKLLNDNTGYSLEFDGVDDYVDIGMVDSKLYTIELWVYLKDGINTSNVQYLINLNGNSDYKIIQVGQASGVTTDCTIGIWALNGVNSDWPRTYIRETYGSGWNHIAISWNNSLGRYNIFVNGQEPANVYGASTSGNPHVHVNDFTINNLWFCRNHNNVYGKCKLREVRIWNISRTQQQIQENMYKNVTGNESSLVGYWKLNEGSGLIAYDLTENNNHGTINGATWKYENANLPVPVSTVPGDKWALSFDGVDDYVDCIGTSSLLTGIKTGTIEILVNIPSIPVNPDSIFGFRNDSDSDFYIVILHTGNLELRCRTVNGYIDLSPSYSDFYGKFVWISFVRDGVSLKGYINGIEVASRNDMYDQNWVESNNFCIGVRKPGSVDFFLKGKLSNARIWNVARTQQQIQENMYKNLTGNESGLVAYYKFDEKYGIVLNDSVGSNHGIINGATWVPTNYFPVIGKQNYLNFDGVDDYVDCGIVESHKVDSVTIEAEIKIPAGVKKAIVSKYSHFAQRGYCLMINADTANNLSFDLGDSDGSYKGPVITPYPQDEWIFVSCTYNSSNGNARIYINGTLSKEENLSSGALGKFDIPLFIGRYVTGDERYLEGSVKQVRIWNISRTQQKIQEDMYKNLTGTEEGLVGYWRLNESSGLIAYDLSQNENHGTINGATWGADYFEGSIDEISVYDKELEQDDINTLYNNGDGFFYDDIIPYGWRKKVIIDHTKIDEDLIHFPLPIVLGTSTGINNQDTSDIFDVIGENYKKLAIYSGTTQLYVEVEYWDHVNKKGLLWVSKEGWTISSTEPTELWIYFDEQAVDNDEYVGEPGSRTEVWNSDFVAVYTMAQDPSGGAGSIKDSTIRGNHGTPNGMIVDNLVDDHIGKSINFDGVSNYISLPDNSTLRITNNLAVIIWFEPGEDIDGSKDIRLVDYGVGTGTSGNWGIFWIATDGGALRLPGTYGGNIKTVTNYWKNGDTYQAAFNYVDSNNGDNFVNGIKEVSASSGQMDSIEGSSYNFVVGASANTSDFFKGKISFIYIFDSINTNVSSWVKADYHAQTDNLLAFGETEITHEELIEYTLSDVTISGAYYTFKVNITDFNIIDEIYTYFQYKTVSSEEWINLGGELLTDPGEYSETIKINFFNKYEYRCVFEYEVFQIYSDTREFITDIELIPGSIIAFDQIGEHSYEPQDNISLIDVLIVAGGGGGGAGSGGYHGGGGGGAGGLVFIESYFLSQKTNIVGVGGGGDRVVAAANTDIPGGKGSNSYFNDEVAYGGGGGLSTDTLFSDPRIHGGSGGGTGYSEQNGGAGIPGQGHDGGGTQGGERAGGAGGGGAGEKGYDRPVGETFYGTPHGIGQKGGDGLYFGDIFGDEYGDNGWFSGGGGGGNHDGVTVPAGSGGLGGGGEGGITNQAGFDAIPNTGGGGGGSGVYLRTSGYGGSGIVLIKEYHDGNKPLYNLEDTTVSDSMYNFNLRIDNIGISGEVSVTFQYRELEEENWINTASQITTVTGTISSENIDLEFTTAYVYRAVIEYTIDDIIYTEFTQEVAFLSEAEEGSIVKIVEHIEVTLSSGEINKTIPLTKFQTIENCVPFVTLTTDSDLWYRVFSDIYFTYEVIEQQPYITIERGHSSNTTTYSIFVVEFNPQRVKVQQGEFNISSATTQSITLDEQVVKDRAAIVGYWKTNDSSQLLNRHFVRSSIESDTQIRFYRNNTTGNCTGHWYVFESLQNDFKVTHMQFSCSGSTNYNIPEPVDLLNSFILTSYAHDGSSTYYSYRMSTLLFNRGTTSLQCSIFNSGYTSYHHAQIVTFTDDKTHVVLQGYCLGNTSGANGVVYDTQYDADYPLTCNLGNSMVNSYQVYGLGMHNDRYNNMHSFARLKFLDKHRIHIATTGGTDLRYCVQVISWAGKSLRNIPRQDYSKSVTQSIEHYDFEFNHNNGFTYQIIPTIKILELNKNQDINNCVPFATYSFNNTASTNTPEHSRNSFAILKSKRCFYVALPSSQTSLVTKAQIHVVEFNPNRFKVQFKEFNLNATTVNIDIDPVVSLDRVFCKFYVSGSTGNMARQRYTFEWISESQIRFRVAVASMLYISAYIVESLKDDFNVTHWSLGDLTGSSNAWANNSYDNAFELVSYNYNYDHASYYTSASTLYKYNSCPVSDLYRHHAYNTLSNIRSEKVKFLNPSIRVVAEMYIWLNAGVSEIDIELPFEIEKSNTIIVCAFQQNLGGVDSGTSTYGQDGGFILLKFKDNKTVNASRTHTHHRVRTFAYVIEFPPANKYYISGTVREEEIGYVERNVSLYSTETGKLVDSTTSTSGTFYLESPYNHAHHVVCNDDDAPKDYNDLIYGKVFPGEIMPINSSTIYTYVTGNGTGVISPAGNVKLENGYDAEFTFEPGSGSALDYIEVNGSKSLSQLDNPITDYTFYNVKKNQTITTCFSNIYTISIMISGTGSGSVSPDGVVEVIEGRDRAFSFTPGVDSHLSNIIIDGETTLSGVDTYTFYSVVSDHTLEIIYDIT